MVAVPAFAELGKNARAVLIGDNTAAYQFNQTVTVASTTSSGVNVAVTATKKDGALDMSLKHTYTAPQYKLVSTLSQSGKVAVAGTFKSSAPGLTLGVNAAFPDADFGKQKCPITGLPLPGLKLSADYVRDGLSVKSALTVADPRLDVAVTTGVDKYTVGADVSIDPAKAAVSKWTVGAGYSDGDFQAAVFLNDAQVVRGVYAHAVSSSATLGTEVSHSLTTKATTFTAGVSKKLVGGSLVKARLDNGGLVSVLYEQEVRAKTKMGVSAQFDALALDKAPKLGFAYNLNY